MNSVTLVQCNGIPEKLTVGQSSSKSGNLISLSKHSTLSAEAKQISKQVMDTARKKAKVKELVSIRATPPPAVARRNARERNRVKQVNNGFANLRQRIPNSIASAFESGRSGNKKLSKVETLRMAVEYIRSLEELLALSDTSPSKESLTYPASTPLISLETQSSTNYSSSVASPSSEDDNFSSNSTPPPLHYIKVSGSDSYSILPVHLVESNERLKSLKIRNELLSNSSVLKFKNEQLSNTIGLGTPRSPGIYSESSLSPGTESDVQAFIPIFNMGELSPSPPTIKVEEVSESANEEMRILCHNLIMLQADGEGDLAKQLNMNELITW